MPKTCWLFGTSMSLIWKRGSLRSSVETRSSRRPSRGSPPAAQASGYHRRHRRRARQEGDPLTPSASIRYLGFESTDDAREYSLVIRQGEISSRVTVRILHAAFADRRTRYQDGPDISFL